MNILHIRSIYLGVSFIDFLLKGFRNTQNYIGVREIKKKDLELYPNDKILCTSKIYYPLWIINKYWIIKFNEKLINDWFAYKNIVKTYKYDIIHAHMGTEGFYSIPLAKYFNLPLVVTFYGGDMSEIPQRYPKWKKRYKQLFKEASLITVEGNYMKQKMIELGCPIEKIYINKISIPIEKLQISYSNYNSNKPIRILMCANFVHKKGYFDAMNTIKILVNKGYNIYCDIVGDGILQKDIIAFIEQNGLTNIVTLHGRKSLEYVYSLAKAIHVFFHPSKTSPEGDSEGGAPTIILEMQALGLPIVSTRHADIPNIIPKENQFLADEGDISGLVEQFEKLIQCHSSWNQISNRGRKFIEREHSNINICKKLEKKYHSLINK